MNNNLILYFQQTRERLLRPVLPLNLKTRDKSEIDGGCRTKHSSEIETDLFIGLPVTRL